MNLFINEKIAIDYTSPSQKARILTEDWVLNEIYCPNCGQSILGYGNNKPVADFFCEKCLEDFELKSKKGKIGKTISAGAYSQMIKRINSPQKPNFFFMEYTAQKWSISDFFVIPKHFFTSEIVEKRNPLSEGARRAGWIGSSILFSKIPKAGHIFYVENGVEIDKKEVLNKWQKTIFLKEVTKVSAKGWILDIMNCIETINKREFSLLDMYFFQKSLSEIHPENKNIKAKIRQQLQFLRDKGYLEFLGNGLYKLCS